MQQEERNISKMFERHWEGGIKKHEENRKVRICIQIHNHLRTNNLELWTEGRKSFRVHHSSCDQE